ncbi:MAG: sigma 54-interacting transcriptional regulator, partial [Cyclobacteriaceae bacterium]|nr:sigma 54-interacting transcriptional regulator [Cyclobacteriaceae bacterium]
TLFLDEIGDMPLFAQAKLLRVLEEKKVKKLGTNHFVPVDFRLISATSKNLKKMTDDSSFRFDLYYRINTLEIIIPPLRERIDDIPILSAYFLKQINNKNKKIKQDAMDKLKSYDWPGNIRELENVIERAVITSQKNTLTFESIPESKIVSNELVSLKDLEKNHIIDVLEKTYWKISGVGGAASHLKINPETLRSKMRKLGIKREQAM